MQRHHVRQAVTAARLSRLEEHLLVAGPLSILAGVGMAVAAGDPGGPARAMGLLGMTAVVLFAASRGVRSYRAGVTAAPPTSVGRVDVRGRPRRLFGAVTVALSLGLPLTAGVATVSLVEASWVAVAAMLLIGCAVMIVAWIRDAPWSGEFDRRPAAAVQRLERLCMAADMPVPDLVLAPGPLAVAWTFGGRIHVTRPLLDLLDDAELDAVLAHELAHLAHRDAAVMDICSGPSRLLLAFAGTSRRVLRWIPSEGMLFVPGGAWVGCLLVVLFALCGPPAFVIGWISRLSVLGISRAREFSADATAAALTGRPSALASALLKLERQSEWTPRHDLRAAHGYAVLCIVGVRSRLGRLFSTHPPTAARVRRLEALEERVAAPRR